MVKESEVKLNIIRNTRLFCPEVIKIIRIFTGKVETKYGGFIQGADTGTADLLAIVKYNGGHSVFIEVKRPGGGRHEDEQKIFEHSVKGLNHVHYLVARSVGEVVEYIKKNITEKSLVDEINNP